MAKILVSANPKPVLFSEIDLREEEWSSLLPENLLSFRMEELRRPCRAYPDGIFPGCEKYGENKQISRIQKFPNYVEFCKVMSDEAILVNGDLYLTSKFYDRRSEGWATDKILKKSGEVIGYCLNADVYCAADKATLDEIHYGIVYNSLVTKNPAMEKLKQILSDGIGLTITGSDEEFLKNFSDLLTKSLKH